MTTAECQELEGLLVDKLDGKLPPAVELRLAAHAESCVSCRASLSRWRNALPALRGLEPGPLPPLSLRRMELAIERELAGTPSQLRGRPRPWLPRLRFVVLGVAAACALVVVGARWMGSTSSRSIYGRAEAVSGQVLGQVLIDGRPVQAGAELRPFAELAMPTPGRFSFSVGRQAEVELRGPGQLSLMGDARAVWLRLQSGELSLALHPRQSGETFTVQTRHGRIEVRGTRFTVGFAGQGSWVHVAEGKVAAFRDGEAQAHAVSAGETFWLAPEQLAPAPVTPQESPVAQTADMPASATNCANATARARRAMRAGEPRQALRLLDERSLNEGQASQRCRDEIGYLRAEALRGSGRLREAIAAYLKLDRQGAEPAMRQNALFAAGELEERAGRHGTAYRRFESALAVAPGGGLREESMARAMQAAWAAHDDRLALPAAQRYLRAYPQGAFAGRAQKILSPTADGPKR